MHKDDKRDEIRAYIKTIEKLFPPGLEFDFDHWNFKYEGKTVSYSGYQLVNKVKKWWDTFFLGYEVGWNSGYIEAYEETRCQ